MWALSLHKELYAAEPECYDVYEQSKKRKYYLEGVW